jgi:hypothetical protein
VVIGWTFPSTAAARPTSPSLTSGWWSATNLGVLVPGLPALALPLTPKVARNQLQLTGGLNPKQPLAFAALRYRVPAGRAVRTLTLIAASGSPAPIEVCPLTSSFSAVSGGPMSAAPAYDCKTHLTVSPEGPQRSYRIVVGTLTRHQILGVALVPTAPLQTVVLARPNRAAFRLARRAKPAIQATHPAPTQSPAATTRVSPAPPAQVPTTFGPVTPLDAATTVNSDAGTAPKLAPTPTASLLPRALAADSGGLGNHRGGGWLAAAIAVLAFGMWRWVGRRAATTAQDGAVQ